MQNLLKEIAGMEPRECAAAIKQIHKRLDEIDRRLQEIELVLFATQQDDVKLPDL